MASTIEVDERVIAKAKRIVKSLWSDDDITNDLILILSIFYYRLSTMKELIPSKEVILRWNTNSRDSLPWEESPASTPKYFSVVDEILCLTEDLTLSPRSSAAGRETLDHTKILLQLAMARFEDEFPHVPIRNTIALDADGLYSSIRTVSLSFASDCVNGFDSSMGKDLSVELFHPDVVNDLRMVADRMVRSGNGKECCQLYSNICRDVLVECLSILGVDNISVEEVQKNGWTLLDEKMKKWIHLVKIVIRVFLPCEKQLYELVFGDSDLIREVCFAETAKGCVMHLLNFGVAIGHPPCQSLFRILDMYDALSDAMPDLQALFPDEPGDFICREAEGILKGLVDVARGTYGEFRSAVQRESSVRKPFQGGGIHPLTKYVMNYIKVFVDNYDSFKLILGDDDLGAAAFLDGNEDDNQYHLDAISPAGRRLVSLIALLESNLKEKSKLYEDSAMQNIFLMNNIFYIVQKVQGSGLGALLGDLWISKRLGQARQQSTSYLQASWTKVLSCLKDEGLGGGGSSSNVSKVALKEKFKNFNLAFEEIYLIQTASLVSDPQLREQLQLSISDKVIPVYRSFVGRFGGCLESTRHVGKYIKYTPEDLEKLLLDLFEGLPKKLNHPRRKLSSFWFL